MTKKKITFSALLAVAILFVTSEVNAQFKGEVMAGYGFKDGYNIGIGIRAGTDGLIESLKGIYIGGVFAYHLGKTEEIPSFLGDPIKITTNLWYAGGDVGYNIPFEGQSFSIRPSSYVGIVKPIVSSEGISLPTDSQFMIAPGATFLFPIGSGLTLGADARYFIVSDLNAFVVNVTIGKSF